MIEYRNLDAGTAFAALKKAGPRPSLRAVLTAERVRSFTVSAGGGVVFNYAAAPVDDTLLGLLQNLADEQQVIGKYSALLDGGIMNTGEKRRVLHHLLRGQLGGDVLHEGRNLRAFYLGEQRKVEELAARVHSGEVRGSTGKPFATVVQIGIGGSDLGPRAMYLALEHHARAAKAQRMRALFLSNVDPDDVNGALDGVDLASALFILVSKSGTTQETLANELLVRAKLRAAGLDPDRHFIAVTSQTSPLAGNPGYLASFYIDDFIGGRYSSTSPVGGAVLTLAFGKEVFSEFLDGAHEADAAAREQDIRKNAALLDALIGVYERNVLGWGSTAVLPYSQALSRFPAHLQQLDMESNGKRVNRDGAAVGYATGPVVFGEPGTNGQHSFYQLLHQGTDVVPLQFVGFRGAQTGFDLEVEGSTSIRKLQANLTAQIVAFAKGRTDAHANKDFPGERPSTLLAAERLTPRALGALLAHFENKVMFQGFLWNLNSFDQEGVQLGKVLAKQVLAGGAMDPALTAYAEILGLRTSEGR
jgi:glucose-6-phosphate isomerase